MAPIAMRTISAPFNPYTPVLCRIRKFPKSYTFSSPSAAAVSLHQFPNPPPTSSQNSPKDLISCIKSCTQKSHLFQIHSCLIRSGNLLDPTIFLHFITRVSLSPFKDLHYSQRMFEQYPKPNVSLYAVLIRAYSLSDSSSVVGYDLYKQMIHSGISDNGCCSLSAIKCCIKMGSFFNGLQVHGRVLRVGLNADCYMFCTLMDFYAVNGKCHEACKVFDDMSYRDIVAWNSLISCYLQNKRTRDVLTVFEIMEKYARRRPDEVTCLFALEACANLNALEFGKRVHGYINECGLDGSMRIRNALIKMYSRCRCIEKVNEVFNGMVNKDVVTWSSMISGLASNGHAKDAIEAFRQMQREGVHPDEQTFTGILSGCSHSGLVNEGIMIFNCMKKDFGMKPNIYHYGCMVDMLSREGLLDEAYDFILGMEVKPDAAIWRTLLGACRIHKNPILGERVVEHLIELKAEEAGDYVLLSNIYSSDGKWEKVQETRLIMSEKGIQTTPACSTIELNGAVHEFANDDDVSSETYKQLNEINEQLRIAGYVAKIPSKLNDMEDEGKESTFSYHSEKLAIAFGVLSTPPGTKLKVAKDLQICDDCHSFLKIFSSVYNRKVVIRDSNRFHYFQEGNCSCNDIC